MLPLAMDIVLRGMLSEKIAAAATSSCSSSSSGSALEQRHRSPNDAANHCQQAQVVVQPIQALVRDTTAVADKVGNPTTGAHEAGGCGSDGVKDAREEKVGEQPGELLE